MDSVGLYPVVTVLDAKRQEGLDHIQDENDPSSYVINGHETEPSPLNEFQNGGSPSVTCHSFTIFSDPPATDSNSTMTSTTSGEMVASSTVTVECGGAAKHDETVTVENGGAAKRDETATVESGGSAKRDEAVTVEYGGATKCDEAEGRHDDAEYSGVTTFMKPVIADVKIVKQDGDRKSKRFLAPPDASLQKDSWSAEAIDRLEILSDLKDDDLHFRFRNRTSTFASPSNPSTQQCVYIELGEYQTLLCHEEEDVDDDDGRVWCHSLPQPQGYSEDTLKAVETVTQKFDSFKLRQMRARSFRESAGFSRRRSSNVSSGRRESNTSAGNGNQRGSGVGGEDVDRRQSIQRRRALSYEEDADVVDGGKLTERDIYRIEVFYQGGEAEVSVCRCMADVFVGAAPKQTDEEALVHWVQTHTGVPVLLLNTGTGLRPRELVLVVAQKDTALPLWQDKINHLSGYRESSPGVHTMKVSGSMSKSVQLRMADPAAAQDFLERFNAITSDPDDELWKISADQVKSGRKSKNPKKLKSQVSRNRKRHLTKADISLPCNSTRLTRVDSTDRNFRSAFGDLLPAVKQLIKSSDLNEQPNEEFRPRLPTK